jgi:hypothetical protein
MLPMKEKTITAMGAAYDAHFGRVLYGGARTTNPVAAPAIAPPR